VKRLLGIVTAVMALAWVSAAPATAQSQATTAAVSGRVTDAQGAVLPGTTVTVNNTATGYTRSVVTNDEGLYSIPLLPPGEYVVTTELSGFAPAKRTLLLTVGGNVTANQQLQVGGLQESVVVEGGSPPVETSATVRTTTVDQEAISNLPINGRRFQDFITLTPTVQVDPQRGQLSFAGQRGINANVNVDGADYNQPFFGGIRGGERSNNAFTVPQESIQEFQVVAAGYSAEFGRSTGGLVNAITKSGSNSLRGSAFYVNRNREWADDNAFGQAAAPTQQQFGGSIGGPISRDKLFFFGAYEQQDFKNTRAVLFSNLQGFTPSPTELEAFNYYKSLETPFDATNNAVALLGRVDYQLTGGDRLSFRYSYSNNKALNSNATGNALDPITVSALSNNGTEKDNTNTFVGQYTSTLRSNLLLEARGQYSREERPREANEIAPTVHSSIGRFGTVQFLPTTQSDWRFQGAANVTGLYGSHTVKAGLEYNHVYIDQLFGFNQNGFFNITGGTAAALDIMSVGGVVANRFDAVGSSVALTRQIGNLALNFATDEVAFFAQDTWKIRPNLTLNYGLRWEGASNPTPEANNAFILDAVNGFTFPSGRTVDPTQIPDQYNQWGPRVGFAWDATNDGKTVVRGFSGLYYARTPSIVWAAPMNNSRVPPGDLGVALPFSVPAGNPNNTVYKQLLLIGIDLNQFPLGALPIITPDQVNQVAQALGFSSSPFFGAAPIMADEDFRNPRATQVGFGVEREVWRNTTFGAEFTYVDTDFLERNREVNLPLPTIRANDPAQRPVFGRPAVPRPLGSLGSIQLRESSAHSEYRALALTSRSRQTWGQVSVNYVLSKSQSDDDNERDAGGAQYENTYDLSSEWGPARLDRRHQFNGYVLFFLPYGFDASTSFRFLSGRPIDATFGSDANTDQGGPDRPYSAPGVPFQRNAFRNEPYKEVNLRLQWGLNFNGGKKMLFTAELFNMFNWENIELAGTAVTNYCSAPVPLDCGFGSPTNPNFLSLTDQNPTSARFGQLLTNNIPGNPRQVQLGVRFQF
jgi:outer membrane receptor for ferrienterochelin and colicin